MTTEEPKVETTTEQLQAESVTPEGQQPEPAENTEELKAQIKRLNAESAERRKRLEVFEKAEAERAKAQMSEIDRLKLEAEQAKAALIEARKIAIAAKHGLPDVLADRLKGETIEDIEADALKLKETIPQPKPPVNQNPTNPGSNGAAKETDAQRRMRLGLA